MFNKIKSYNIFKKIFSYVSDRKKLKLIKYNKHIQKKLGINIIYYKTYSGKFIINEKNGKVKEYCGYTENLIFKGEYLNEKRHGKGKEYNSYGKLIFEGEYLK